jgi:hypothetical protein
MPPFWAATYETGCVHAMLAAGSGRTGSLGRRDVPMGKAGWLERGLPYWESRYPLSGLEECCRSSSARTGLELSRREKDAAKAGL